MKRKVNEGNASFINRLNKVNVLNCIYEGGIISRADIVKQLSLSAPTVTRIVKSLVENECLVNEVGAGDSTGGRPPHLVQFAGADKYIVGIDLGTTHIYGILANLNAEIISEINVPSSVDAGFHGIMEKTRTVIKELIAEIHGCQDKVLGVGIAVAGLVNKENRIVEFSPDFHWTDVDVAGEIKKSFDIHVVCDNVTRVTALSELWFGSGRQYQDFIVVNIGYGIGAGIIIDGKPLYGAKGMAGEFGHVTLDMDSDILCECGNYGCLEALASGRGIALAGQRAVKEGAKSRMLELCGNDISRISADVVVKAAKLGDETAREIFDHATRYIGIGIAGLINLFNPQAVFIGGGVTGAGDLFFEPVRNVVKKRALPRMAENIPVLPATFKTNATVMGAVSLILNDVLYLKHVS